MSAISLPEGWLQVPLPTLNNKDFCIYVHQETHTVSFTAPFSIHQLQDCYKIFFDEPLNYQYKEVENAILATVGSNEESKRTLQRENKNLTRKQKIKQMPKSKQIVTTDDEAPGNKLQLDKPTSGAMDEFCKTLSLANLRVNTHDAISLLVQTCEAKLNTRPIIEFTPVGKEHRCTVKIEFVSQEIQAVEQNKKKAKNVACKKALEQIFPKLYQEWLILTGERNNEQILREQEYQQLGEAHKQSLLKQTTWQDKQESLIREAEKKPISSPDVEMQIDDQEEVKEVDPKNLLLEDPRVIEYNELISPLDPSELLTAYATTKKRQKVKFEKSVTADNTHKCVCRFYTKEIAVVQSGSHESDIYKATQYAAQNMLKLLLPHLTTWIECVDYIKTLISETKVKSLENCPVQMDAKSGEPEVIELD